MESNSAVTWDVIVEGKVIGTIPDKYLDAKISWGKETAKLFGLKPGTDGYTLSVVLGEMAMGLIKQMVREEDKTVSAWEDDGGAIL